jgi:hypothetical protein
MATADPNDVAGRPQVGTPDDRLSRIRNHPWMSAIAALAALATLLLFLLYFLEPVVKNETPPAIVFGALLAFVVGALVLSGLIVATLLNAVSEARSSFEHTLSRQRESYERTLSMSQSSAVILLGTLPHFGEVCKNLRGFAHSLTADFSEQQAIRHLRRSLSGVADVYGSLTGVKCRLCIKGMQGQEGDNVEEWIKTFLRDSGVETDDKPHSVKENTDFQAIIWENESYWFSNDLMKLAENGKYTNSSLDWPSKYLSTIVWPIRSTGPEGIIGFLCLDSLATNVFIEERDVHIGFAFVDLLSMTLDRARALGIIKLA